MKIKNLLYVVLFVVFAVSCTPDIGTEGPNGGGGNTEKPSNPTTPTEPAYIKFGSNYVVADYDGAVESVVVDVNPDWEWEITTSGEEWFSAER